jgi:hypothetical protein
MKRIQITKFYGLAVAALLLGGASLAVAQTTDTNLNVFDSSINTEGTTPKGGQSLWGVGTILWDNSQLYPGTTGSAYISAGFSSAQDTPIIDCICFPPYDNWYWNGNGNVDISQYSAIQFQLLWDTNNSSMSIDQFNDLSTYQASLAGSVQGIEIQYTVGSGIVGTIAATNIPDAASNGWVTITIPVPPTISPSAGFCGIALHKWMKNNGSLVGSPTAYFWISNVRLLGTAAPPPPPIVKAPAKPTSGLNIYASTSGNSYYDRQQVGLVSSNGLSWVGHATVGTPVTYSFTINGFPQDPATQYGCESYLMMTPNPVAYDNAIDWNEPNCVVADLQQGNGSTVLNFTFKTNNPNGASGYQNIGTVTNTGPASAMGTWTITFTSDNGGTLTAPNGNTGPFTFPGDSATIFAESANPGFYVYLGMQANNAASMNKAVCYSHFSVSGVASAQSDNFLADSTLNTNIWFKFMSTAPVSTFIDPTNSAYWVSWTLPASGYQLQTASSLFGPWTVLNSDLLIPGVGLNYQLVTTNDIPASAGAAFFDMVKH